MKYINCITISGKDYQVYRNSDGFLELFRSVGVTEREANKVTANKIDRHVTNVKDTKDLAGWFRKKKRAKKYDPYKDENQLKLI